MKSHTNKRVAAQLSLFFTFLPVAHFAAADDFAYYASGNPEDVVTETSGLLVLQGGGTDVDENYRRMGELSGGGDFVVIRASGDDDYNDYIFNLCNCDSVETLVFENRQAAYDEFVIEKIRNAEALFIAGGDQSRYVHYWKGTPVEDAIQFVAAKPAPIGGTSAGMAILGQFTYSAMTEDSLLAANALANPFHHDLTIEADFLNLASMENLITDQHLVERDRIGRTVALMARLIEDELTPQARAMAADRETSVHVDPASGDLTVHSTTDHESPYVYMLRTTRAADVCEPERPLSIEGIEVYRLTPGATFNLKDWTGSGGIAYSLSVAAGTLKSSRGEIY
jgi:cyanophycinase-like exopeptidase